MKAFIHFLALSFLTGSLLHADPQAPIDASKYDKPIKVACVGASITQGPRKGNYPEQLQAMLGDQWEVGNFGHSGFTLLKKGDRSYWKSPRYQKALEFEPDVVIINLGTNDAKPQNWQHKEEFIADYKQLVASFQALETKPRIYICRPCPVFGKGAFRIKPENMAEQRPMTESIIKELAVGMIDMNAPLEDRPELIPDKIHPNKAGYRVMAATAYEALTGKEAPAAADK
ncbi:MAG: GDSL-type esterase/lipase family protein [Akkermansiaceae bacterium]|nr:GDSL-type esterase/lipase family protein [Akkermansiaceae bacterium]